MENVPLSTKLGEVMAPGVLVTSLMLAPDGTLTLDPATLHGRSELEQQVTEWVKQRQEIQWGKRYWIVWVAIELDEAQRPKRYLGCSASELLVDTHRRMGYKSVAMHVNRMTEAMRGMMSLGCLSDGERQLLRAELARLGGDIWERSEPLVKDAFGPEEA